MEASLGWPDLVVGLFAIGFLCAVPEAYSAWRFARLGKPTVAVSSATSDGIVSLTLALLAPALVGAATGSTAVYVVNLAFLALVLAAYAFLNHRHHGQELGPGFVTLFGTAYLGYAAVMACVLMRAA